MPVPAFGFSVGDFIAAIEFSVKVIQALRDSQGAISQYEQRIVQLEGLLDVLQRLQALRPTATNTDLIRRIHSSSYACSIPVRNFVTKVEKFDPHLGRHYSPSSFAKKVTSGVQKVQWALVVEPALAKLEVRITPYMHEVEILLLLDGLDRVSALDDRTEQSLKYIRSAITRLDDLQAVAANLASKDDIARVAHCVAMQGQQHKSDVESLLQAMQAESRKRASAMHELREGLKALFLFFACMLLPLQQFASSGLTMAKSITWVLDSNIHLQDALGRPFSLPYQYFRHWSVLENLILCEFNGHPGEGKVRRNEYSLMAPSNYKVAGSQNDARRPMLRVIAAADWGSTVQPGDTIMMSMLLKPTKQGCCPRCRSTAEYTMQEDVTW
ncbi:hypothetical protein LTR08_008691 [Meristemomyces frigidus]|nr:hypothetical protein LTR08_008691 [Meristemomyces frigidus]